MPRQQRQRRRRPSRKRMDRIKGLPPLSGCPGAKAGDDVAAVRWIGLEGTSLIACKKEKELRRRFAGAFIEEAKAFAGYVSSLPDGETLLKLGASAFVKAGEGGVYGALWQLAQDSGVGLEIALRKIPIRQETVEICEYFRLHPYRLLSGGCILVTAPDGESLICSLKEQGTEAVLIGRCTDGKARTIRNGEDTAFLERPREDEVYKIIDKGIER